MQRGSHNPPRMAVSRANNRRPTKNANVGLMSVPSLRSSLQNETMQFIRATNATRTAGMTCCGTLGQ